MSKLSTILLVLSVTFFFTPFLTDRVDEELVPFHDNYISLLSKNCPDKQYKSHSIAFGDLPDPLAGVCLSFYSKFFIVINKRSWDELATHQQKALVYHELSHCYLTKYGFLARPHIDDYFHYMYPSITGFVLLDLEGQVTKDIVERCDL